MPGARQGPVMHSLQTCIEDLGTELGRCGLYKWQTEELGALSPCPTFRCQGSSRPWARPSSHGPLHLFPGDLIYPQLFKLGLSSSVWFLSLDSQVPCILDRSALLSLRHLQRGMSKVAVLTSLPIPSFLQSSPWPSMGPPSCSGQKPASPPWRLPFLNRHSPRLIQVLRMLFPQSTRFSLRLLVPVLDQAIRHLPLMTTIAISSLLPSTPSPPRPE